mmetsp:Transcript_43777/g.105591  ORF Transcript_43777/g.105591 Transcript_43777/m.105591 type:complete len:205 (+) Transcript_43777:290-904(+)
MARRFIMSATGPSSSSLAMICSFQFSLSCAWKRFWAVLSDIAGTSYPSAAISFSAISDSASPPCSRSIRSLRSCAASSSICSLRSSSFAPVNDAIIRSSDSIISASMSRSGTFGVMSLSIFSMEKGCSSSTFFFLTRRLRIFFLGVPVPVSSEGEAARGSGASSRGDFAFTSKASESESTLMDRRKLKASFKSLCAFRISSSCN